MYHKAGIQTLSKPQIHKLLRGHRVRVKHGSGHTVHLSEAQLKKLMSAHKKNAGMILQFDPYQMDMHKGAGFWDVAGKVTKALAPTVIDLASDAAKSYAGSGFWDVAGKVTKALAPTVIDLAADAVKNQVGSGIPRSRSAAKRGRGRKARSESPKPLHMHHGHGLAELAGDSRLLTNPVEMINYAKNGAKRLVKRYAPEVIDLAGQTIKDKIGGMGMPRRSAPRRGRGAKGGALNAAGYGDIGAQIGHALGDAFIPF